MSARPAERLLLARQAMATRFELILAGNDPVRMRAAGEEALSEIGRTDRQLSRYRVDSEVSILNRAAAGVPIRAGAEVFGLLHRCGELREASGGAFDVTVGALVDAWRTGPDDSALRKARTTSGGPLARLDAATRTVTFGVDGVAFDFGGIGKGVGIDRAMDVLTEYDLMGGLLHGGTSTAFGWGTDVGDAPWRIAIAHPNPTRSGEMAASVTLGGQALSVSSGYGRGYVDTGTWVGHVVDPRSGRPAMSTALAAVIAENATEADALSTALLVLGRDAESMSVFQDVSWLVGVEDASGDLSIQTGGRNPALFEH